MKKRTLLILILALLAAQHTLQAQDTIDVKEIVRQQIAEAKKREYAASISHGTTVREPSSSQVNSRTHVNDKNFFLPIDKIIVLATFSVIIFSFVAYRRKKAKSRSKNVELKKNIELLREEKFIKPIDPRLKRIRTSLCLNSKYLNSKTNITETARKYNIAKTELLLAAKFHNQTLRAN